MIWYVITLFLLLLRNYIISITFTKKNGEERIMKCTLKDEYIISEEKKSFSIRKENTEILPVWDLENSAWRSFRIDSVKEVKIWEQN